jgi:hypothetical protein
MRLLETLTLGTLLTLGLAPAARADHIGGDFRSDREGHYETRTVEYQEPGRWVDEVRTVTDPGHWEEYDREECIPGHYETRCVSEQLPGHFENVERQIWDGCCYRTVCERVWVPGRTVERQVQVWVPPSTRVVRDRRWVPGCTHTETVRVFKPGCTSVRTVQVFVPGCPPAPPVCRPAPRREPAPVIQARFGGKRGVEVTLDLGMHRR